MRAKAKGVLRAVARVELHEAVAHYTLSCGHKVRESIGRGLPQIPGHRPCVRCKTTADGAHGVGHANN